MPNLDLSKSRQTRGKPTGSPQNEKTIARQWRRTARGRLKFELAGIAFARKHGLTPEEYADHLWSSGAVEWMKKTFPPAGEYLKKEIEAFQVLYPEVAFDVTKTGNEEAELVFKAGTCLGGWGKNQWAMAHGLGLGKGHVCRYCRRSFRVWSAQLGLDACPEPLRNGTCVFRVRWPAK